MKTTHFSLITILSFGVFSSNSTLGDDLTLPLGDPYNQSSTGEGVPETEYTPAELATPPVGQIQKSHLRDVNRLRTNLTATLAAVPAGADGQGSEWFTKANAFKTGLDAVAANYRQSDCFALISHIDELLAAKQVAGPDFAQTVAGLAKGFSTTLIHAIERHINDQYAVISTANLNSFIKVFSTAGFLSEGDWEASPIPVDAAGIMILDPAAVVTKLQTQPWEEAERFLGGQTLAVAFGRYAASGNGLAGLKTKYAANQGTIHDKWTELAEWVAAQHPPD